MSESNSTTEKNIINSFDDMAKKLDRQISLIELRQQELRNYIITIENHINHFDQMIDMENQKPTPNYKTISSFRSASFKNIELITVLHNTYKEYEGVKFRYFKEISDNNYKKQKLINVDIKRAGTSDLDGQEFYEIMRKLSNLNVNSNTAKNQIHKNEQLINEVQNELTQDDYEM